MRYTRYNHNNNNRRGGGRRGKNNFFLIGLAVCIPLAIGIGMIFGPMIFKQGEGIEGTEKKTPVTKEDDANKKNDETTNPPPVNEKEKDNKETVEKESFFILQCGVYGKEENAKTALKEVPEEFNKFISKDGDKFKVIAGIYKEEEAKKKSDELSKDEIVNVKIRIEIPKGDANGVKLSKIMVAYMDIIEKFENKDTKSVNLEEFKKWTEELKDAKNEENDEVKKLKEHIKSLPKVLERKDVQKSVEYIYNILNKYRV
ncbi:MAG: SPOR domain-containing protein [Clostridium sp.]